MFFSSIIFFTFISTIKRKQVGTLNLNENAPNFGTHFQYLHVLNRLKTHVVIFGPLYLTTINLAQLGGLIKYMDCHGSKIPRNEKGAFHSFLPYNLL